MPSPHRHLSVDELSQRASTGLAIRRGEIKISDPIPSSYVHNSVQIEGAYEQPQPTPMLEGTWPRSSGLAAAASQARQYGPQSAHISRFTERTSLGPSLAASSNMSSTPSKDSSLQRRNTGFRATIRRMFSSKKGRNTVMQPTGAEQQTFSRSQSMGLTQQSNAFQPSPLHFSTVAPSRALNSHAPSPHLRGESENLVRPQPSPSQFAARRNTEPSLLMVQLERQASEAEPVTARLRSEVGEQEDARRDSLEEDKGDTKRSFERPRTAIRRNTPPPAQLKRRSRSADALADLLRSPPPKPSDRRDRAEEIAFWRNSIVVNPLPPLPNPEQFRPIDPVEDRKVSPSSEASGPTRPSIEPIQEFDFGLNEGSTLVMPATLQERVNTLEVKLYDFEFALAKLQGVDVTRPNLPKKPSRRKSLRDVFPESGDSSAQESSSGNDLSYVSSRSDQWVPTTPRDNDRADRTSKATTIKPAHRRIVSKSSQISSPSSIRFTREEYDTLRTMIEGEKSARQQLEMQVMNLQKEVDILKSPVYAYIQPAKYPTPSPDSCHDQAVLATPRLRHFPPTRPERDLNETSRFSMTETEPDTDGDQHYPETYETPQETVFHFESRRVSPPGMI